jgi:cobalt-zinc-cadmium efflux system membrane fusion protein
LTLGLLGGLALWGSLNDWKLPWSSKESAASDDPLSEVRVISDSTDSGENGRRIEFPSAEAVTKAGIRVEPVQVRRMVRYITANGMVDYDPARYARLTARASGSVWRVEKEIGDTVHKGDVLALIDATEVGQAKADLMQSLTQVDLRGLTVERLEAAHKRGAVSEQSLREAQAALSEARIRLSNDHQRLLNFGLPVRLDDLTKVPHDQLAKQLRLLGLPEDIRKQLDTETLTANLLPLTAPFDGVVVQRTAATGEIIEKNQPKIMFVLADVRHLHVDLDVNPEDMGLVRAGMEVTFTPTYMLQKSEIRNPKSEKRGDSNYGSETPDFTCVTAKVSHISPEVDEKTRRVKVHAEFDNSDGRLRPNDFGIGRIFIREEPNALVVPSEAVQSDGGSSVVFVLTSDNKSFTVRPVHTGLRDGNVIEVRGVQAGEKVATTGGFALLSELLKERIVGGD